MFYVCDRVAWLIEVEGTAECGVSVEWTVRHPFCIAGSPPEGGTPIHYLYGYVPPNGAVILKLLI